MRKKKCVSENAFRKQLIREGYWNWLTENPKPINVNWGIIEANLGYRLSAKSKNALNKSLYKSLYKTILESDEQNTRHFSYLLLESDSAPVADVDDDLGKIRVDWNKTEKILGSEVPDDIKDKFEEIANGTSFQLSKFFKILAMVSASMAGIGLYIKEYAKSIVSYKQSQMASIAKSANIFNDKSVHDAYFKIKGIAASMGTPKKFWWWGLAMLVSGLVIGIISIIKCHVYGKKAAAEAIATKVDTSKKITKFDVERAQLDLKEIWKAVTRSESGGGVGGTISISVVLIMCATIISRVALPLLGYLYVATTGQGINIF